MYHLLLFFLPLLKGQEHPDFHDYMKGLFNNDNKWTNFLVELNRQTVVCPNISPFIFRSYIFRFRDKFDELALRINYGNQTKARCLKITKKSRSTRAKRATFTLWVDKSSLKTPKMVSFNRPKMRLFGWFSNTVPRVSWQIFFTIFWPLTVGLPFSTTSIT